MKRYILIGLLLIALVYCFLSHFEELHYVPDGAIGVMRDTAGTVSESVIRPGQVWLRGGQEIALYRTTPIDATIPARQLRGVYNGKIIPALGVTYQINEDRAGEFRSRHPQVHRSLRRDPQGLILPGFYAVVTAMRKAVADEKEPQLPLRGGADRTLVEERLQRIGAHVQDTLRLTYGEILQVRSAWVAASGFDRFSVELVFRESSVAGIKSSGTIDR